MAVQNIHDILLTLNISTLNRLQCKTKYEYVKFLCRRQWQSIQFKTVLNVNKQETMPQPAVRISNFKEPANQKTWTLGSEQH